jgi:ribosomal protein L30E
MIDEKTLSKTLTGVAKTGKYIAGYKEVWKSVKGSKVVITSLSLTDDEAKKLQEACNAATVPFLQVPLTSVGLGKALGKQFRVSALAVRSQGDANLNTILGEIPRSQPEKIT